MSNLTTFHDVSLAFPLHIYLYPLPVDKSFWSKSISRAAVGTRVHEVWCEQEPSHHSFSSTILQEKSTTPSSEPDT